MALAPALVSFWLLIHLKFLRSECSCKENRQGCTRKTVFERRKPFLSRKWLLILVSLVCTKELKLVYYEIFPLALYISVRCFPKSLRCLTPHSLLTTCIVTAAYAVCKDYLANVEGTQGSVSASQILLAGTLAGIPASFLTTPADVVKTRLQVSPRAGDSVYSGIGDCVRKMYIEEGPTAFFKGSLFRVCRIAPQFGISLLCYEHLSKLFGKSQTHSTPPTNAPVDPQDYRRAFNLQPTLTLTEKSGDVDSLVRALNMGFRKKPKGGNR